MKIFGILIFIIVVLAAIVFGFFYALGDEAREQDMKEESFVGKVITIEPAYGYMGIDIYSKPWYLGVETNDGFKYVQYNYNDIMAPKKGDYGLFNVKGLYLRSFDKMPEEKS